MMVYEMVHALDVKEIGCFPQVQRSDNPARIDVITMSENFWFRKADLARVQLPIPVLAPGAKPTDLLSYVSMTGFPFGLLISTRLKEILESSNHREMQFFPTHVHTRSIGIIHYWFTSHFNFAQDLIDFERSEIWKNSFVNKKPVSERISIRSFDDYLEMNAQIKPPLGLRIKKLVLNTSIADDFFALRWTNKGVSFFVSAQLKRRIEEEGCTGLSFEPMEV